MTDSIFREARRQIEEHGWGRGSLRDRSTGAFCALGGIFAAINQRQGYDSSYALTFMWKPDDWTEAARLRDRITAHVHQEASDWNDDFGRVKEDVFRVLDELAEEDEATIKE